MIPFVILGSRFIQTNVLIICEEFQGQSLFVHLFIEIITKECDIYEDVRLAQATPLWMFTTKDSVRDYRTS